MNTTPRKFYAAEDGNNPYPGCKILTAENPNGQNSTSSGQPDKKLTPMAAHIEWLKKERKTLYEFGYDVAADRISKAIHNATSLLEAEREYASQQALASTPPVSAMEDGWVKVEIDPNEPRVY